MKCPNCGNELTPDDLFRGMCLKCKTLISGDLVEEYRKQRTGTEKKEEEVISQIGKKGQEKISSRFFYIKRVVFFVIAIFGICLFLSLASRLAERDSATRKSTPEISDFKPGSEPDGFRGIKWGTDMSINGNTFECTLPGMAVTGGDFFGDTTCLRRGDELKIGGSTLSDIRYGFWEEPSTDPALKKPLLEGMNKSGKFYRVLIRTNGSENWTHLKDAIFEKFGPGEQKINGYSWRGKITRMSLQYNEISEKGQLLMDSEKIAAQQEEWQEKYNKQKAKEGAEKGF